MAGGGEATTVASGPDGAAPNGIAARTDDRVSTLSTKNASVPKENAPGMDGSQ